MDKYLISTDTCEMCYAEYIQDKLKELYDLPDDQTKTQRIHKVIEDGIKQSTKTCIRIFCREQSYDIVAYHNFCIEHLYKMIDLLQEKVEETHDLP